MNKILIIEDDSTIGSIIGDILGKYGVIHTATSKTQALQLLKQHTFNLVIADYFLGDSNGLEIAKEIHQDSGIIPIILISAYPTVDMLTEGIDLKVVSFLRKPINFDLLIEKVESLIYFDITYKFGAHKIVLKNSSLGIEIDGEETQLTEIQFKMMRYFLDHTDKVIDRDKMVSHIWGSKKLNSDNILDTHLLNLKKRLPIIKEHLRTIPRIGYALESSKVN